MKESPRLGGAYDSVADLPGTGPQPPQDIQRRIPDRPRNQLTGAAGLYAAAAVGLALLMNHARATQSPNRRRVALILPVILILTLQGHDLLRALDEERLDALKREPCAHVGDPMISADVIRRVKLIYELNNPGCN